MAGRCVGGWEELYDVSNYVPNNIPLQGRNAHEGHSSYRAFFQLSPSMSRYHCGTVRTGIKRIQKQKSRGSSGLQHEASYRSLFPIFPHR
jgi:hypothetical protein